MSVKRFGAILRHLRFDDSDARAEKKVNDEFALFRKIWNFLVKVCEDNTSLPQKVH